MKISYRIPGINCHINVSAWRTYGGTALSPPRPSAQAHRRSQREYRSTARDLVFEGRTRKRHAPFEGPFEATCSLRRRMSDVRAGSLLLNRPRKVPHGGHPRVGNTPADAHAESSLIDAFRTGSCDAMSEGRVHPETSGRESEFRGRSNQSKQHTSRVWHRARVCATFKEAC
jgi:hypothetical protein